MNLMRSVFETARREWKWIKQNPMSDVRWRQQPKGRARRVSPNDEADLIAAFGLSTARARSRKASGFNYANCLR